MENLQKLCFNEIAVSFKQYYYDLFSARADNIVVKRGMDILREVYSSELRLHFYAMKLFKEEFADVIFMLLDCISTKDLSNWSEEAVSAMFRRSGSSFKKVVFEPHNKELQWENLLCYIPNVKEIHYLQSCNDDFLRGVAKFCSSLEVLDVSGSLDVTDKGVKYLCKIRKGKKRMRSREEKFFSLENKDSFQRTVPCPRLKKIILNDTSTGYDCVKLLLKNLTSLQEIGYYRLPTILHQLHEENVSTFGKAGTYNLRSVDLSSYSDSSHYYDEIFKACITLCPKLDDVACVILKQEHLTICSMLPAVHSLILLYIGNTSVDMSGFLKKMGRNLRELWIKNFSVSLSDLGECYNLETLTVDGIKFQYDENISIPMFLNLVRIRVTEVDLSNTDNFKAICQLLASAPALKLMAFVNCCSFTSKFKTEVLTICHKLHVLEMIQLIDCTIDTEFLMQILRICSNLKHILISQYSSELEDLVKTAKRLPNRPTIQFCNV